MICALTRPYAHSGSCKASSSASYFLSEELKKIQINDRLPGHEESQNGKGSAETDLRISDTLPVHV